MADAYGLSDTSLLSGDNAGTARMIQGAFDRNAAAQQRQMDRYNLTAQTSPAMVAENIEDRALGRAQTTAGLLNQNQQLQHVIDASHATPHGLAANLAAYLPAVGALSRLAPFLFGTNATSAFSKTGLIPSAYNKISSWFKDPNTGYNYALDSSGQVVHVTDASGNSLGGGFASDTGQWPSTSFPSAGTGDFNFGSDFGSIPPVDWSSLPSAGGGVDVGSDLFGMFGG